MKIYQVGGCVRDTLMGKTPHDIDWLVVGATPEQMIAAGFLRVGADFPVFLHPQTKEEYALARKERKTSAGHKGFETQFDPSVTLEEDLSRRDLTINAMALDVQSSTLLDPYGGQADLKQGILRHVSEAFSEDPLRVMRLARFQARTEFTVAPNTLELCKTICANGSLQELSRERICTELRKLIQEQNPSLGITTLLDMGALHSISPDWSSRMDDFAFEALSSAVPLKLPEWAMVRLALCQRLPPKETETFLTQLRFPTDIIRWCTRVAIVHEWATRGVFTPECSTREIERSGAPKFSPSDRIYFEQCLALELISSGIPLPVIHRVASALVAAPAIAHCDLSSALAGPKQLVPSSVFQLKTEAFMSTWKPLPPSGQTLRP